MINITFNSFVKNVFPINYGIVTSEKLKFSIKDFLSNCDQISNFLQVWSHLLKTSLMENFIFCAVCSLLFLVTEDYILYALFDLLRSQMITQKIYLFIEKLDQ